MAKTSSYDTASSLSKWFSFWILPFLSLALKNQDAKIELEDVDQCPRTDEAKLLFETFNIEYESIKKRNSSSNTSWPFRILNIQTNHFLIALVQFFKHETLVPFLLFFIQDCVIKPVQPILVGIIIRYFYDRESSSSATVTHGDSESWSKSPIFSTVVLCTSSVILIACHHPSLIFAMRLSMRLKIIWSSLIYSSVLKLKSGGRSADVSKLVNLLNNDIRRFDEFALTSNYLFIVPIQTCFILTVAWFYIGVSCLATMFAFLVLAFVFSSAQKRLSDARAKTVQSTEARVKIFAEVFRSLKSIKIYTLENRFVKKILDARQNEVSKLRIPILGRSFLFSFSMVSNRVILYFSFLFYLLFMDSSEKFYPETIFVSVALFERLRYCLTWSFPLAISGLQEMLASCRRMNAFLEDCDRERKVFENFKISSIPENCSKGIAIKNLTTVPLRKSDSVAFQLKNISLDIKPGERVSIIGNVACGKSVFLLSLLNEIPLESAQEYSVNGTVSYVSQEVFCVQATIRENILFGLEYDKLKYSNILELCALEADLKNFVDHDLTMVEENGQNLSGGQRARINLARALYRDCDIYLLDDIFSAVDSHLSRHIYERCIEEYLKDKCVLMATHQLQFIPKSTRILLLSAGQEVAYGRFPDLINENREFGEFFNFSTKHSSDQQSKNHSKVQKNRKIATISSLVQQNRLFTRISQPTKVSKLKASLVEETETSKGSLVQSYLSYFKRGSGGWGSIILVIASSIITQTLLHGCDHWLTLWGAFQDGSRWQFLGVYTLIVLGIVLFAFLRSFTFYKLTSRAASRTHNQIAERLVRAPLHKVENISIGSLLSCFTRDIGVLDETLPSAMFELNLAGFQVITILAMILTLNPVMTSLTIVYFMALAMTRRYYVKPAHSLRSFEVFARSRFVTNLSSTLRGLPTIRAYGSAERFEEQFQRLVNRHTSTVFMQMGCARFFCQLVDLFALAYIVVVICTFMFGTTVNASLVAPCLGSIFNLIGVVQWAFKRTIDTDLLIMSYENFNSFQTLPCENVEEGDDLDAASGQCFDRIDFNDASIVYHSNENVPILSGIDLTVRRGEKIGICGRSGSGKSTLINSLLGFCRASSGRIDFNDKNLEELCLAGLRRRISLIPQAPVIFTGTIRQNIDLFSEHSDNKIWNVLVKVQLDTLIQGFGSGLDEPLDSDAQQLSLGQKQLLCLARIMIQNNDLIILDESTASVDFHTDKFIQRTIREVFHSKTVITIAHRLDSIIDSDRILVLSNGRIVEDGAPKELLSREGGEFASLVQQTGPKMSARLVDHLKNKN